MSMNKLHFFAVLARTPVNHYSSLVRQTRPLLFVRPSKLSVNCQPVTAFITNSWDGLYFNDLLHEEHHDEELLENHLIIARDEPDAVVVGVPAIAGCERNIEKESIAKTKGQKKASKKKEKEEASSMENLILKEAAHSRSFAIYLSVCLQQKMNSKVNNYV